MMEFYAVKQNFYVMLKKHPNVCQDITVLSNEQCDAILHKIDAEILIRWYNGIMNSCD